MFLFLDFLRSCVGVAFVGNSKLRCFQKCFVVLLDFQNVQIGSSPIHYVFDVRLDIL